MLALEIVLRDVPRGAVAPPQAPRCGPCGREWRLVRGASAIRRDRLTTEERLSDIVEILAHGLLWLDAFSVDLCSHIGSSAALAHVASWPKSSIAAAHNAHPLSDPSRRFATVN